MLGRLFGHESSGFQQIFVPLDGDKAADGDEDNGLIRETQSASGGFTAIRVRIETFDVDPVVDVRVLAPSSHACVKELVDLLAC